MLRGGGFAPRQFNRSVLSCYKMVCMKTAVFQIKLVPLFLIALSLGCVGIGHPSDQVLEQRLESRKVDFEKLITMLKEDSDVVRLGDDFVFTDNNSNRNLPEERLAEYRRLFRELNIKAGMHRDNANTVRLIASSAGMFIASSEKSYVYSSVEPSPLVNSLDSVIRTNNGDQPPVFKRVSGNWYLYYESW